MSLRHSCVRPAIRTGNFGVQGREARVVLAPLERDGLCSDALSDDLRLHAGPRSITARLEPVHDDCGAGIVATAQWKFAGMHDPAAMPRSRGQDAPCLTGAAAPRPKPMWLAVWCCRAPCGQHVTSSAGAGFVLRSCRRCDPVRVAFPVPLSRSPRGVGTAERVCADAPLLVQTRNPDPAASALVYPCPGSMRRDRPYDGVAGVGKNRRAIQSATP